MRLQKRRPSDEVEAIKYTGKNGDDIRRMVGDDRKVRFDANGRCFVGNYTFYQPVNIGEWILVEESGAIRSMSEAWLFNQYEEVAE